MVTQWALRQSKIRTLRPFKFFERVTRWKLVSQKMRNRRIIMEFSGKSLTQHVNLTSDERIRIFYRQDESSSTRLKSNRISPNVCLLNEVFISQESQQNCILSSADNDWWSSCRSVNVIYRRSEFRSIIRFEYKWCAKCSTGKYELSIWTRTYFSSDCVVDRK